MIRITCTSCQKPLSLDETKLPMREVSFPCPVCKAALSVDRRNFENAAAAGGEPTAPGASSPAHDEDDHQHEIGAKALLVGVDNPSLRQAAKLIGYLPVHFAEASKAREFYMQEFPQVVFINPAQLTQPPLESMAPIISLMPGDRRKSFFILVAEGLRTLDGNAAFLYGVNLVVTAKDLGHFTQIYREGQVAHERLYAGMKAAGALE
jgi:hypothetical protein